MTPNALSTQAANHSGGAPVLVILWASDALGVAGERKGLTTTLAARPIGAGKARGILAMTR
jgi:hypothetical protein